MFHSVSNLVDCLHDLELCALLVLCLNVTLVTMWFVQVVWLAVNDGRPLLTCALPIT